MNKRLGEINHLLAIAWMDPNIDVDKLIEEFQTIPGNENPGYVEECTEAFLSEREPLIITFE